MAEKKRNERSSMPDRKRQDEPTFPDRRALEKQLVDINKLLREQEFESVEEINEFLNRLYSSAEPLPVRPPETPLEKAQEIMFQAFDARGRKRIKLARKALKVSEDCDELRSLIERGVHDGKAQVRKPFFLFSTNFYGDEYLHLALDDNAASIRRWAAKKLKINA